MARATVQDDAAAQQTDSRNEVLLVGRVSGTPEERELPSGDVLMTWRLVVARPAPRRVREGARPPTVDTLDCVAWTAGLRRTARSLADGDVVEVRGALRRRFWRAGAGAASRCEVEVAAVRRIRRVPELAESLARTRGPAPGGRQSPSPSPRQPGTVRRARRSTAADGQEPGASQSA